MVLKPLTLLFGVVFIAIGILGFVPAATPNGQLFGIYQVDSMHNIVHLVSGIIALFALYNLRYARLYLQIFGIIYLLLGIIGLLGLMPISMNMNFADHLLHIGIGVVGVVAGFFAKN